MFYLSLLLACAVLACIVAILAYGYSLSQPKGGVARNIEELKNVDVMLLYRDSLPKDGRNFHYYAAIYPPYINVSFEISEKGFRKWASEQGWEVSEIDKQKGPNIGLSLFKNCTLGDHVARAIRSWKSFHNLRWSGL